MCRLWFVRMPKPAEDSSTAAVEAEVEGYRMQVQLLNESLTIKRVRELMSRCVGACCSYRLFLTVRGMTSSRSVTTLFCSHFREALDTNVTACFRVQIERDHASENTQSAQEILTELRETYEAKRAEAEPFRQRRRELREAAQQTSEKFKCVDFYRHDHAMHALTAWRHRTCRRRAVRSFCWRGDDNHLLALLHSGPGCHNLKIATCVTPRTRSSVRWCRSHYGDLAVHSEAELDAALAAIDHKLHHETVPLAMEKRLIADHKKLSQQRERVR